MYRTAIERLKEWKSRKNRLPLIIKGTRQVGKTWLMKEFGRTCFENVAYVNFDRNERLKSLFSGDFRTDRLLEGLSIESGMTIVPETTLIIFDEIQEAPEAIHSLKYFAEDESHEYFIVSAGSLLGIAHHTGISFPVGKVEFLDMYPLTFPEFLIATGNEALLKPLKESRTELVTVFRDRYIDLLKTYYFVGGMPRIVDEYIQNRNLGEVRRLQENLIEDYRHDFSKHAPASVVSRINLIWDSIPGQLAKENRKYIYSLIREGARAREFEIAIQWLMDMGLCHKVCRVSKGGVPLKSYQDFNAFKLYVFDVGLLGAMAGIDSKSIIDGNAIFTEFKGSLTENYVCQQLVSENGLIPFYWSADGSSGEVDFVVQVDGMVVPIEVKAQENLSAKSLKSFISRYSLGFGVRTSLSNYRKEEKLINIPLYGLSMMRELI